MPAPHPWIRAALSAAIIAGLPALAQAQAATSMAAKEKKAVVKPAATDCGKATAAKPPQIRASVESNEARGRTDTPPCDEPTTRKARLKPKAAPKPAAGQ